ncbi:MAG: hypothetical protein ACFFB7_04315 [Candidatus Sifarchaeia archaeon]
MSSNLTLGAILILSKTPSISRIRRCLDMERGTTQGRGSYLATTRERQSIVIFCIAWISVGIYVLFVGDLIQKVVGAICIGPVIVLGLILYRYYYGKPSAPPAL